MTINTPLSAAPVLVELYRGHNQRGDPLIERVHHGIIAVVDGLGKTIFAQGDIEYLSHMRSTAKPFQILPLFEMGFFDDQTARAQLGIKPADIVLMMSSHAGEPFHTTRVQELLTKLGLDHHALRCGSHPPYDTKSFCELLRCNEQATELHNNCSGKHLAMLIACLRQNFDPTSYENAVHPLQQWIKRLIAQLADFPEALMSMGIDGCSIPSLTIPLKNLALCFARFSYWAAKDVPDAPPNLARAFREMWSALRQHPEFLAGTKRFDSALIRASGGSIISKSGADGLIALAIAPDARFPHGLGVAIKIADGDVKQQIRPLVTKALLEIFKLWPNEASLLDFLPPTKNFRGLTTGGGLTYVKQD